MMEEFVTLDYGSGGGKTSKLISEMIVPLFSTSAACSTTRPPSARIVPALMTLAEESSGIAIVMPSAPAKFVMSRSLILAVEATSEPTSTLAFLPNSTPFGLMT